MIQNLQGMSNDSLDGATLTFEKKSFHQVRYYCLLLLVNAQISRTSDDEFKWMKIIRSRDVTRTLIGGCMMNMNICSYSARRVSFQIKFKLINFKRNSSGRT